MLTTLLCIHVCLWYINMHYIHKYARISVTGRQNVDELFVHTLPWIRRHRNMWNQHPGSMLVVKSITSRREDLVREVFGMTVRVNAVKTGNPLTVSHRPLDPYQLEFDL